MTRNPLVGLSFELGGSLHPKSAIAEASKVIGAGAKFLPKMVRGLGAGVATGALDAGSRELAVNGPGQVGHASLVGGDGGKHGDDGSHGLSPSCASGEGRAARRHREFTRSLCFFRYIARYPVVG